MQVFMPFMNSFSSSPLFVFEPTISKAIGRIHFTTYIFILSKTVYFCNVERININKHTKFFQNYIQCPVYVFSVMQLPI